MLSRLIITFLCAAAIGSASRVFLTFDLEPVVFKDTDISTSVSVQLLSKPIEEVTVYLEHPSMFMSTCAIVFNPDNWNVLRPIGLMPVPSLLESSDPLKQPEMDSGLLLKAVSASALLKKSVSVDFLKIIQASKHLSRCNIVNTVVTTFDGLGLLSIKPGWYQMVSTEDLEVQILWGKCGAKLACVKTVVFRYGSSVMSMDTRGPVKGIDEYSMTEVTRNTNGVRYTSGPEVGIHRIVFPCGSKLSIVVFNKNGAVNLQVILLLVAGYQSPRGLCNIPQPPSPDNKLIGFDGKLYSHGKEEEVDVYARSWGIKDEDVLTNPGARTSIPPIQRPRTMCKFPKPPKPPQPKLVIPVPPPPTTTGTTTTGSTTATAPYSASTLPSTTSTTTSSTATIYPPPPTPSGYVPPPPPPPPYVIVEIKKCCQSIFNIPSCNAIVPAESYIQSCISDAQTSGSYVFSDKVKQTYLAKCRTLTDDMIRGTTKEAIDQGTKIKKECGFGNGTCINSCSGKGTCTDSGCACSPGFSGMDCSMDLTKATQYDQSVNEYRINVNVTIVQQPTGQHSKLPVSDPYATPAPYSPYGPSVLSTPSVDQSLASFVGTLPKPSTVSPQIAKKSQPVSPESYDDFQKPIISSVISLGPLHMVSAAAVVITSYILLL
ncbi:hypothetical protein BASA83_004465 [Batrachochytrium salamandrivorans]|nr:hypothetical protein BASA83_004465 [Batrachochytrium salamandrivorans]